MQRLVPGDYPNIDHPDFAPGHGRIAEFNPAFPAPPSNILRALAGPRPYRPVDLSTLRVGDEVATIGFFHGKVWSSGRITQIEDSPQGSPQSLRIYVGLDYPDYRGYVEIYKPGYFKFPMILFFLLGHPRLFKDEAQGLAEISETYQLPHELTGKIKEAITGLKPKRFHPGSKKGGRTRKAKKHKQTRRRR